MLKSCLTAKYGSRGLGGISCVPYRLFWSAVVELVDKDVAPRQKSHSLWDSFADLGLDVGERRQVKTDLTGRARSWRETLPVNR